MEGEKESKAPVRVRLLFADRKLLSKAQRSEGFRRSWAVIRPDLSTVAEFCRDITCQFGLKSTSGHDLRLWMDGFRIPLSESTSIFKDNDEIRVKGDMKKMKMENKKAVASPTSVLQIKERDSIDTHIIVSSNRVPLVDNGREANEKKQKKRKRPISEETSSKREQKEAERPNCSKKKKMKPLDNARQATINESKKAVPAVATPSHCHIVNQKTNAPVLISERYTERNQQVVSISKHTSTGFSGGQDKKNMSGACLGVGTHQSRPRDWICGQTRFMSPGAGPSNWQENGPRKSFQGDRTMTKKTSRKSRSGFNGPNVHDRNWEPWGDSSGPNAINSQPLGNNFATEKPTGKVIPHGEELNGDKYFESFNPPPRLPMQGDIMAFRLDIIDDLGCPGLSSFRVGKVIVFDPVLMIIFIQPVPEYRTPDCEVSEYEKSMYKEDGSLEIGFESLVDLRLIKESKVKITPKMSGKGKSKSKASNRQDGERNDNNVNSAWETGNASNAEETTEHSWGAWAPSTGTAGASGQNMVQHGTGFGSQDGKLSNGWNGGGANNSTLAWEANNQAPNSGQGTQAQQNGWDAWEPSTSHAGLSWPRVGQHRSGFGSGSGHSRGGRKGRGGKHFNPKFKK